jgi:hypothetical protein
MATIFIRNKNDKNLLLACDEGCSPLSEGVAGMNKPRAKAFYVKFPGGFAGVYSSPQGPVAFVNGEKRLFIDPAWSVWVQKVEGVNKVSLAGLSREPMTFEYPAVELDPLDPWSEEEFDDFFIWLMRKRSDQEFIQMWTDKE